MIVDEAQNLSPHEVKTIITRAAEGTKIILTGDCEQIDSPYLDAVNNGLSYVVERLKAEGIVGHATLRVGERSALSEIASKLL
jgi:PhoH-like ATPase